MIKFSDLNLNPKVLRAIEEAGYETPTPIQAGAIPPALEGRDVLGIAQTGTGKTASFTLPMITMLARGRARARMPRSLVLCPTRELAAQVAENFETYAKHVKLTKALLIGGVSFGEQDKLIDKGVDVLIATPGRLLDHFERGKLILNDVKIMVVDEADRMLDMGFIPDIERIFGLTPFTRQTLFFSATMAPEIERITNTFLSSPERIEVARQATTSENITQGVVMFKSSRKEREATEKRQLLRALIDAEGAKCTNAIIFCNRKMDVDTVAKSLKKHGYDAAPIHGDLDQSQRTRTLDGFRAGDLRFLVASDVAARGLDVPAVSHVFNFDVPSHAEDYVHRIGRTGRAGRDGTAIMICVPRDEKNLADVERLVQNEIPRLENPLGTGAVQAPAEAKTEASAKPESTSDKPKRSRSRSRKPSDSAKKSDAAKTDEAGKVEAISGEAEQPAEAPVQAAQPEPKDTPTSTAESDDIRTQNDSNDNRSRNENSRNDASRNDNHRNDNNRNESERNDRNRNDSNRSRNDNNRNDNNRNRRNNDRGGNQVVGLGDHLPDFIGLSFEERDS
ncbi:Superfamily II DNA and RNA helicase [Sulfitobacter brevis]|uniref:DEAD-box ATP-dependent RNA helicase RhpA n=1 Tax=Sulfitobacter brevis TaxID=74348 RepID=A0A1I2CDK1_9RHOB|nr:DEAD/DEAH box helicase [Sulfitobacter brevis]SFE66354.1 Superfamily II DNA and RNA helicase [Sulfitobacter brevis]